MDPDAALRALRAEVATHLEHGDGDVNVLVEHVSALDEWLSTGGFRPTPWRTFERRSSPEEPVTHLQVNGDRVSVPLSALDLTNPDGVTVWERGLGGESPYYYPPGMTPDSWREAHVKANWCDPCGAVDRDARSAEPSTYEDPAVQRAIAETIARGDV